MLAQSVEGLDTALSHKGQHASEKATHRLEKVLGSDLAICMVAKAAC